jgi:hypothetical protein
MFSLSLYYYASPKSLVRTPLAKPDAGVMPAWAAESATVGRLACYRPETSYGQGDAIEMVAINTMLIIVNSRAR